MDVEATATYDWWRRKKKKKKKKRRRRGNVIARFEETKERGSQEIKRDSGLWQRRRRRRRRGGGGRGGRQLVVHYDSKIHGSAAAKVHIDRIHSWKYTGEPPTASGRRWLVVVESVFFSFSTTTDHSCRRRSSRSRRLASECSCEMGKVSKQHSGAIADACSTARRCRC